MPPLEQMVEEEKPMTVMTMVTAIWTEVQQLTQDINTMKQHLDVVNNVLDTKLTDLTETTNK